MAQHLEKHYRDTEYEAEIVSVIINYLEANNFRIEMLGRPIILVSINSTTRTIVTVADQNIVVSKQSRILPNLSWYYDLDFDTVVLNLNDPAVLEQLCTMFTDWKNNV